MHLERAIRPAGLPVKTVVAERAMAALVVAGVVLAGFGLASRGYLPQPFYYRVSDTLMDLHRPALWAHGLDAYHRWRALYPPLSFVILQLASLGRCYAGDEFAARDCDWLAPAILMGVFLLNGVVVFAAYRRNDPRTAAPRAVAVALGLPMLYALERGNLLIPCFTAFALGYADLLRKGWPRWTALAMAFNFKPYLALVALPLAIKRQWAFVAGCAAIGVLIYIVTLAVYGSGSPWEIIANDGRYSAAASKGDFADLYFATAYWPLIRLLGAQSPSIILAPPAIAHLLAIALTAALRTAQVAALACLALAAWRPDRTEVRRLAALVAAVSITAFTTGSAGYSQIFLLFLVFFEPWRGPLRVTMLTAAYLLCLPVDWVLIPIIHQAAPSYLGGRTVMTDFGLSVGQILRPGLLLVIQTALVMLNLADLRRPCDRSSAASEPA